MSQKNQVLNGRHVEKICQEVDPDAGLSATIRLPQQIVIGKCCSHGGREGKVIDLVTFKWGSDFFIPGAQL